VNLRGKGAVALKPLPLDFLPGSPELARVKIRGEAKSLSYCRRTVSAGDGVHFVIRFMALEYCYACTFDSTQSLTLHEGAYVDLGRAFSAGSAYTGLSRVVDPNLLFIQDFNKDILGPDPAKQTVFAHPSAVRFDRAIKNGSKSAEQKQ
jgi:hypothetical protein